MAEYIDRERLKEAFNADLQYMQTLDEHAITLILTEIDEAPAADVAPVVHGKWKIVHVGRTIKCSNCGRIFDRFVNGAQLPERCFCGAKMDGGEKANE